MTRLQKNIAERRLFARGMCEAHGLHHPDCPGTGTVTHHVYRKGDTVPSGLHRDDAELLRYMWGGTTTLGAGGCHGMTHNNPIRAELMGLLGAGNGLFGLGAHLPQRFWDKVEILAPSQCWEWTGAKGNKQGHGKFKLDHRLGSEYSHRLAMGLRLGDTGVVCHSCDNPPCCNPIHLVVADQAENMGQAAARKRTASGANHWMSKGVDDVFSARYLLAQGFKQAAVAKRVGRSTGWVSGLALGRAWTDGPWPSPDSALDRLHAHSLGLFDNEPEQRLTITEGGWLTSTGRMIPDPKAVA